MWSSPFDTNNQMKQVAAQFLTGKFAYQEGARSLTNTRLPENIITIHDLHESGVFEIVEINGMSLSRGGVQLYGKSFGSTPVLFCAPCATGRYMGDGNYEYGEQHSASFCYHFAEACNALSLFPLCAIAHIRYSDPEQPINPLVQAIDYAIETYHISLFVEVRYTPARHVYFATDCGLLTPYFAHLAEKFSRIKYLWRIGKPFPSNSWGKEDGQENTNYLCSLIARMCHIPTVVLYLPYKPHRLAQWDQPTVGYDWQELYQEIAYHLPRIANYCQSVLNTLDIEAIEQDYRAQVEKHKTQPLLPAASSSGTLALPAGRETGVIEQATTLELLDGLYARYGGGQ